MNILFLTRYGRLGASSRIRTLQYLPYLATLGIDVIVEPLFPDEYLKRLYAKEPTNWMGIFKDYLHRLFYLSTVRKFDLLWIEKELFPNLPSFIEQFLNSLGVRYVVDYDDAIFHGYDLSNNLYKKLLSKKIDKVMNRATLVVCGNEYLAARARQANVRRVEILPTVIDLNRYEVFEKDISNQIVIGWIGSPSTVKYLDLLIPALKTISSEFPIQLRVIGAKFAEKDLDVSCRLWSEKSETTEIQNFDIGVMPLLNSPWERGKCGYKLVQYMACGVPVIASPVGVNREIVRHGVNGYLAESTMEWVTAFRQICSNSQMRHSLGLEGRHTVEDHYCLQVTAPRLARLLKETANR
ncbi:glycosyltransferase family 4 protein [Geopsychrobacter electrodiphilus]|uniref:glycosyltransferase family 4 protein n=1 Tax=Geopsychrobacter electrodiphilus TaxID=225196 RepID=UPI00036349A4|nr:glycosyltransferase family 4 protein [Geopsychrobacter electrodiphilus]